MTKKLLLLIGAALLVLAAAHLFSRRQPTVTISPVRSAKSNYHFIPEHWQEPKLRVLREQENFKEIEAHGEFDLFLKLCDWTHRQWRLSQPDPYPLSNALDILAEIRAGRTGGFCGQYAYVLADALKAMGYFAVRYVEMWSSGGESHFAVESWSDQFGKWLLLDPTENLYYVLQGSGQPAHAMEIRDSLYGGANILARSADAARRERIDSKIRRFANFAVSTRSDLMRLARPVTVGDRFQTFLFFRDGRTDFLAFGGRIPYSHQTSRPEDLYFDCNYVLVEHRWNAAARRIDFTFATEGSMFNFDRFAVSLDQGKNWLPSPTSYRLEWDGGTQTLWVAAVNMAGRFGRPTRVAVSRSKWPGT